MKTLWAGIVIFLTIVSGTAVSRAGVDGAGQSDQQEDVAIQRLDWLIGSWSFDDAQVNGDYRETGTRDCRYALDEQYILCDSQGVSASGKTRSYRWYINYNKIDARFEMTSLLGNYPRKLLYTMDVSDDGRKIELVHYTVTAEGVTSENGSTIVYDGEERYVWNIRSEEPDPKTGEHPITFRDTVVRR